MKNPRNVLGWCTVFFMCPIISVVLWYFETRLVENKWNEGSVVARRTK